MEPLNCKIAIISWPVDSNRPIKSSDIYFVIAEIYDQKIKSDLSTLLELNRNLKFLYPFRIKKNLENFEIQNNEDFKIFRNRYKLTKNSKFCNYERYSQKTNKIIINNEAY